jgi:hypothetical protein
LSVGASDCLEFAVGVEIPLKVLQHRLRLVACQAMVSVQDQSMAVRLCAVMKMLPDTLAKRIVL